MQPIQTLDFLLDNKKRIRTLLTLHPDATGKNVGYADLSYTNAGSSLLYEVPTQSNRSVIDAGRLAYQFAQQEAKIAGNLKITEAHLEGEEFLEKSDIEQITGNAIVVIVV